MPGIWLALNAPINYENIENIIAFQQEDVFNIYSKKNRVIYRMNKLVVGALVHDDYPLIVFENQDDLVVLDGKIYGISKDEQKDNLLHLCSLLINKDWEEECRTFVSEIDGEFIIIMINKPSTHFAIFNDSLGRLPFFFCIDNNCLIAARSINNIVRFFPKFKLNNFIIACQLLLEHPIGNGTFLKGVNRWPEGNYLRYIGDNLLELKPFVKWNFDYINYQISFNDMIENLTSSLIRACKARCNETYNHKIIVSLSGGFDSRVVATALKLSNVRFSLITRETQINEADYNEVDIAKKVGSALEVKHDFISIPFIAMHLMIHSAIIRDGVLSIDLAPILAFLIKARELLGSNIFLFTGDGGDKTLAPLTINRKINTIVEMVDFLLEPSVQWEKDITNEITKLRKNDLKDNIIDILVNYPEISMFGKYRGMKIRQRYNRWLAEGEDRNREVFWSTTPFFSPYFFKSALSCPNEWKKKYKLTIAILELLNYNCSLIPRAGYIGATLRQRVLITLYNSIASQKWLLKLYRSVKTSKRRKSIISIPQELDNYILKLLADESHPLLNEVPKETIQKILSVPYSTNFKNRFISMIISLPEVWNSIGLYCK